MLKERAHFEEKRAKEMIERLSHEVRDDLSDEVARPVSSDSYDHVVEVKDMHFGYEGGEDVLKGVNLTLDAGEVMCLLGLNGCGKSTMLQAIAGVNHPREGSISIAGNDVSVLPPEELARLVAVVPQDHRTMFAFTVREVIAMGRTPYLTAFGRMTATDWEIVDEALDDVGLADLADTPYTKLSGGQRQLVLVARALAQQAKVMLLDEPTSHLDFRNQSIVLNAVVGLAKDRGIAVLMITHSPDQALMFPCTVALMERGLITGCGRNHDVMTSDVLAQVYAMDVRVLEAYDARTDERFLTCVPILNAGLTRSGD